MKRGNADFSMSGLLIRISLSPDPNRDVLSAATAMIRYVVSDSGSLMSALALPLASVTIDPSQNASTLKSFLSESTPLSLPPPPPSSSPFGTMARRLTRR